MDRSEMINVVLHLAILLLWIYETDGQCTFPSVLRGNWISSEKGTLEFTDDTIIDYAMPVSVTVTKINLICKENEGDRYLLQSSEPFSIFGFNFAGYICLELNQISDYKYWYQLGTTVESTTLERIYVQPEAVVVGLAAACDRPEPYEIATFSTLIKEGAVNDRLVEATCPESLFHTFSNGSLSSADGSTSCVNSTLNVCNDRTKMIHTYGPDCDSSLRFSTRGEYICLLDMTNDTTGVTYLHIWNNDTTLKTGVERINCYAFEKLDNMMVATMYPGACLVDQTSDSVSSPGIIVEYNSITKTCLDIIEPGPQAVYFAAFVLGATGFLVLLLLVVCITYKTRCHCIKVCVRRLCMKQKIGHSDTSLEDGMEDYLYTDRRNAPPGVFVARKPIKLGPIIEPYLEPPPKVELLYDIEPRPSSSRWMFSRPIFLSQLSLKIKE